ncbi:MAG: hypothetical protein GY754_31535 [bacterium]|nr:hypothetical protein [bacterium]
MKKKQISIFLLLICVFSCTSKNPAQNSNELRTELFEAVKKNEIEKVKKILSEGIDIDIKNKAGESALVLAILNDHFKTADFLISKNANISIEDKFASVPLNDILLKGNMKQVNYLVSKGATVNDYTIFAAARNSYYSDKMIRVVLEIGGKIDFRRGDGYTPLILASYNGNQLSVKQLIKSGAKLNIKDNNGWTALMHASNYYYEQNKERFINVVRQLLSAKASVKIKNKEGKTALDIAINKGHCTISLLLKGAGAKIRY